MFRYVLFGYLLPFSTVCFIHDCNVTSPQQSTALESTYMDDASGMNVHD